MYVAQSATLHKMSIIEDLSRDIPRSSNARPRGGKANIRGTARTLGNITDFQDCWPGRKSTSLECQPSPRRAEVGLWAKEGQSNHIAPIFAEARPPGTFTSCCDYCHVHVYSVGIRKMSLTDKLSIVRVLSFVWAFCNGSIINLIAWYIRTIINILVEVVKLVWFMSTITQLSLLLIACQGKGKWSHYLL